MADGENRKLNTNIGPAAAAIPDLFRRIVDSGPAAVGVLSGPPDFVYEYVNDDFQAFTPDIQMVGVPFAEAWPELAPELVPLFYRVIRSGEPEVHPNRPFTAPRLPGKPPETIFVTVAFSPLRVDAETWILMRAFDTTEEMHTRQDAERRAQEAVESHRRHLDAEEARERTLRQLRDVIDNSPAVIYFKDTQGHLLMVNDQFLRLFQMSREDIVGHTDEVFMPEEYVAAVRANDREVIAGGKPLEIEEEIVDAEGNVRTFISAKFPLRDSSGEIYGVAGVSTDITQRKREEQVVRESEERFRKVFDEGPLGMLLVDPDQRISRANDRLAQMLKRTADELCGMDVHAITPPEDAEEGDVLFGKLLSGEIPSYSIEKRYLRSDGTTFLGSLTVSLLRDAEGRPQATLGMIEDITDRKRAEEAFREKEEAIRNAYTDVLDAVTGGRLVLMTRDELETSLGEVVLPAEPLAAAEQLRPARDRLTKALEEIRPKPRSIDDYVLAASEALTNTLKHAGGGRYEIRRTPGRVQVVVSDSGPGIHFRTLPRATLVPGFSTQQTLGMGFTIMLDVCDRVLLATQAGFTAVVLEVNLEGSREG